MARLNKIAISLCALLFTSISLTPLAHASGHTHASATPKAHPAKGSTAERKKKATQNKSKSTAKTTRKKTSSAKSPTRITAASQTALNRQVAGATKKCVLAELDNLQIIDKGRRSAPLKNACCVKAIKSSVRKR